MRRKITMLFVALLACVGVMKADVTDLPQISTVEKPIYYTIMNTRSSQPGGLMYYAGDEVGLKDGCTSLTLENKYKFFFTGSHEAMYVHNAATGKKLATIGDGNHAAGSWTDEGTEWAVGVSPMGGGLAFGPKGGLNGNGCWNECNYQTAADKPDFTTWSASDAGSIFVVELAENFVAPISDLFYVIEAPLFEKVQGVKKALYVNEEGNAVWGTEDLTNYNFYWIPTVKADGTIALKNFGAEKYLSNATGTMSGEAVFGNLNALGSNSFNINFSGTIHAGGHNGGQGANGNLVNWGGTVGSASAWTFVQKNDPTALAEVVVKYSFTYGGQEKYSQETTTLVGEEYPAFTIELPFGVSATKPAGEVSAEGAVDDVVTKVIELSVNLPFTYAADYASIENWYYMNIHTDHYYLNYAEGESMALTATTVPADQKDAYSWAFVGDPFNGYQLVNKAAGANVILSSSTTIDGDGANTWPIMTETPVAEGNNTLWIPTASNYRDNGFYLEQKGVSSNKMNRRNNKLAYWTGGADAGSTFVVELRDDSEQLRQLVASAQEYLVNLGAGTSVGCVTADSKAAISNAIATANTAIENKTGYNEAQAALQAELAAVETIQPEAGKFYTIVSSCTDDHRAGQEVYVNNDGGMQFAKVGEVASEIARVFQFVPVPANDGKFYLYNIEKGAYMQSVGTATEIDATKAKPVTITNLGAANIVKIVPDGQNMMHAQDAGSKIVGWNNNSTTNASAWTIAEANFSLTDLTHTLTVTEAGWATLVLGYNAEIPTDVKVYAVSAINDGSVALAEVEDVLPAHTPVLIEAAAGEYAFNYTAETEAVENNLLAGSVFNVTVEGPGYILGNKEGVGVGLYKAKSNEGKFVNKAHKAYLPVAEGDAAPAMFSFGRGEGTTAIDNAQLAIDNVVIYDLTGRRVEKMEKGIYIVNGKKVIR